MGRLQIQMGSAHAYCVLDRPVFEWNQIQGTPSRADHVVVLTLCPGWGQFHIFRTSPSEPVVRFFRERSNFFQTSIVERLVVIL